MFLMFCISCTFGLVVKDFKHEHESFQTCSQVHLETTMADLGSASGEPDEKAMTSRVSNKPPLERIVEILKSIIEEVEPAGDEEKGI